MWKFKPFVPKEQVGLEGRSVEIGNLKLQIRNTIAEGGFSCVYLARDISHPSKQYALKHVICTDEESLELVTKEISVMKLLKGHPNIVTLHAHNVMDTGRTKEAFLVMEFCEKSLAGFLEGRGGAAYFEEKQILLIFRDLCNAVYAMHCHLHPIAHRDLKAENLLFGSDGSWKLCDFGSTSTNHKRFDKAEEMGVEEDVIRKHTTPAYRAPEMWDLYRREVISEKVDIWALGCLLFRLCYLKSAFDGDSKLQILNVNYRIPELPKYIPAITGLIKDTLRSPPDARPDITQVWFRVNEQLPVSLQKQLPDMHPSANQPLPNTAHVNRSPPSSRSDASGDGPPLGAFWATQESPLLGEASPDGGGQRSRSGEGSHNGCPQTRTHASSAKSSTPNSKSHGLDLQNEPRKGLGRQKPIEFGKNVTTSGSGKPSLGERKKPIGSGKNVTSSLSGKPSLGERNLSPSPPGGILEDEIERLKELLREAVLEKANVTSKYEKLSAICRSQRQVIQELKQVMNKETESATYTPEKEVEGEKSSAGRIWELEEGMLEGSSESSEAKTAQTWLAFGEESEAHRTRMGSASDSWGFGTEGFTAETSHNISGIDSKKQPAGWAGF